MPLLGDALDNTVDNCCNTETSVQGMDPSQLKDMHRKDKELGVEERNNAERHLVRCIIGLLVDLLLLVDIQMHHDFEKDLLGSTQRHVVVDHSAFQSLKNSTAVGI